MTLYRTAPAQLERGAFELQAVEPWNGHATVGTHNWERLQRCRPSQTWFFQVINQPPFRLIQAPRVPMNRSTSNRWQNRLRDTASRRLSYLDSWWWKNHNKQDLNHRNWVMKGVRLTSRNGRVLGSTICLFYKNQWFEKLTKGTP